MTRNEAMRSLDRGEDHWRALDASNPFSVAHAVRVERFWRDGQRWTWIDYGTVRL